MLLRALDREFLLGRELIRPRRLFSANKYIAQELERAGLAVSANDLDGNFSWYPKWTDQTCVIVGSGPSANTIPIELAKGKAKFIAVNNAAQLAPWADVVYSSDFPWWKQCEGLPRFAGIKISQDDRVVNKPFWNIFLVKTVLEDNLLVTTPGEIGWGGNSGFGAINLAVQFGVNRIVLVGFDMNINNGVHWHGKHPVGMNNPSRESTARWRDVLDAQKPLLSRLGVEMLNASPDSALTAYQKVDFREIEWCLKIAESS